VKPEEKVHVSVTGDDPQDALYSFLSELLFMEDCDGLVLCEFDVTVDGNTVTCNAKGQHMDFNTIRTYGEIKAVTYHNMIIDSDGPSVTVLYDV